MFFNYDHGFAGPMFHGKKLAAFPLAGLRFLYGVSKISQRGKE